MSSKSIKIASKSSFSFSCGAYIYIFFNWDGYSLFNWDILGILLLQEFSNANNEFFLLSEKESVSWNRNISALHNVIKDSYE